MNQPVLIQPSRKQLPAFNKAAEMYAKIIAQYLNARVMNRFNRSQLLAEALGFKNYPDMSARAIKIEEGDSHLHFFQNSETNRMIAQSFSDVRQNLSFESALSLVEIAKQAEANPSLNITLLINKLKQKESISLLQSSKKQTPSNDEGKVNITNVFLRPLSRTCLPALQN